MINFPNHPLEPNQSLQIQFEYVAAHLIKQGERSVGESGKCLYRGPNGLMCAAGCRIPEELYQESFENSIIAYVVSDKEPKISQYLDPMLGQELQIVHDSGGVKDWPNELITVAEVFDLEVPDWLQERAQNYY